jgi:phenylacetate-CoA ligase
MSVFQLPSKSALFHWKNAIRCRYWSADIRDVSLKSREEIDSLRFARVKQVISHCAQNVPYYREVFRKIGLHPQDVSDWATFQQIPILEKEQIRERCADLRARNVPRRMFQRAVTGGSTGQPLEVFGDRRVPTSVLANRILNWWGVDVSDNCGYLYRAVPRGIRRRLIDAALFPTRRAYIHAAEMTPAKMQAFYDALRRMDATYLVGYVGAVDAFATFLEERGATVPSLKAIWTTAAPLPEFKRTWLERIFGCPVYTQYGSVEVGFIAAECAQKQGLHVFTDVRHLEVVAPDGSHTSDGSAGDIVVTDLINYAFPILRYRLGDRGRWLEGACACGRPFARMDYVQGRVSDQIYLPDGTIIPGEFWTTIFDDWPAAVKAFEVHQDETYDIVIRYQPAGEQAAAAVHAVQRQLVEKLRGLVNLDFRQGVIDVNDNGKTRYVVSALAKSRDGRLR